MIYRIRRWLLDDRNRLRRLWIHWRGKSSWWSLRSMTTWHSRCLDRRPNHTRASRWLTFRQLADHLPISFNEVDAGWLRLARCNPFLVFLHLK
jgi:hypothetical protein